MNYWIFMFIQSVDKDQLIASQQSLQQISSQFSKALRLNSFKPNGEMKVSLKFPPCLRLYLYFFIWYTKFIWVVVSNATIWMMVILGFVLT